MPIDPGTQAPDASARNQHGELVSPDTAGPTVLYFYPKDDTPGCRTETEQFSMESDVYQDAGVTVYGVSADDVDSHRTFAESTDIEFDILADTDGEIMDAYGIERGSNGRAERTTIVLKDGEVHQVYENVNPDGHAREVLMDLLDDGIVDL